MSNVTDTEREIYYLEPRQARVIDLTRHCHKKWQDRPVSYWYYRLCQEVGELGSALANDHEDPPEYELRQIAEGCAFSVCRGRV